MIFEKKTITLKNGHTAILRNPSPEDAKELLGCIIQACGETDHLARYPEEWNMTVEQEEAWINRVNVSPSTLSILCDVNGKISGNCELRLNTGLKTAHRATVAIALLKEYWGLGIGSAMFEVMIQTARDKGIEILELEYIDGNDRGKHLYEKFGFQTIAKLPHAYKLKDGSYQSSITMQKYL
ncbi:MAG: GNAT family N-acetyltransferase [Clostridia bacterium]|nr:GNAT family N-acetyltransferase [Clostridia bacterium]